MGVLKIKVGENWVPYPSGPQGAGLVEGGSKYQTLIKKSATDYDTAWDNSPPSFANLAALKTNWTSPPNGAFAYLLDEHSICVAKGGTWRWWDKVFPYLQGANPSYLTWFGAPVQLANSRSWAQISGGLWFTLHCFPAVTSTDDTQVATLTAPYRPPVDQSALAMAIPASSVAIARMVCYASGTVNFVLLSTFAGGMYGFISYNLADLVAA